MNIYLIFIIISSLIGIKFFIKDSNKEYLNKDNTAAVKGIFILIVFYSHLKTYMPYQATKDFLMYNLAIYLGQLMVTLFLFYSGYGIYESIKKKKSKYINSIPKKRFLKTLIHFDIAVITFALINILTGWQNYSIKEILSALIGWGTVGNSNWYIFAILCLYLSTFASFKIIEKDNKKALFLNWILTILIMVSIAAFRGPNMAYCYNTLLCYPLGMTYSYYKDKIDKIIFNNQKYILVSIITILAFIATKKFEAINVIWYSATSILFTLAIVLITVKINLKSKILVWCGKNLFWLYILQRIPMMILSKIGYAENNAYRFALICIVATIILTIIYSKVIESIEKIIENKKTT